MRRLLLLLASAALLTVSGAAGAKTSTVTITKNGYVPNSLSIVQGDTVQFTNSDTVAHQVVFKSTTGVTCSPNPLVLQPSASGTCTFASAGSYSYSDPNFKGNTYRGSITVTAPPESLTLGGKPVLVIYGGKVALSGVLSTQKTGENIDVLGQQCGANAAAKVATVQTTTGGVYASPAQPLANTSYTAKHQNTSSSAVAVSVRPRLALAKVAAHRFSLKVTAGASFAGKYASFQRYNATLRRWVAVKPIVLKASTAGVAPAVLSTASFRSAVKAGLRVRATLGQAQVGGCYAPGLSNTIKS
jgi:plastocyanin